MVDLECHGCDVGGVCCHPHLLTPVRPVPSVDTSRLGQQSMGLIPDPAHCGGRLLTFLVLLGRAQSATVRGWEREAGKDPSSFRPSPFGLLLRPILEQEAAVG